MQETEEKIINVGNNYITETEQVYIKGSYPDAPQNREQLSYESNSAYKFSTNRKYYIVVMTLCTCIMILLGTVYIKQQEKKNYE